MAKKIYLAHNFNDASLNASLPKQQKNLFGFIKGEFVFVSSDTASQGEHAIEQCIASELPGCDAAIFLLADDAQTSPLLEREAELAIASGLLILGARIKGTINQPPARLRYWKKYRKVSLKPGPLEEALNQLAKTI